MDRIKKGSKKAEEIAVGFGKALAQAAIGFIVFAMVVLIAQEGYFRLLPGSWFLASQDVIVNTAQAGQNVPFEWCRNPRHGTIDAKAFRTFYRFNNEINDFEPVSQYEFQPNIEPIDQDCQRLALTPERQPQIAGTYYFTTDLSWTENGQAKKLTYKSNSYNLIATADSLRNRIKELEAEIDVLEARLKLINAESGSNTSNQSNSNNQTPKPVDNSQQDPPSNDSTDNTPDNHEPNSPNREPIVNQLLDELPLDIPLLPRF